MKYLIIVLALPLVCSCLCSGSGTQQAGAEIPEYNLNIDDLRIRDPFIFADKRDTTYYLHVNSYRQSIVCYKSKDLRMWKFCGESFTPDDDFWGTDNFWSPDMFCYEGKYYIFTTVSSDVSKRGTAVLVSDYPDRDFKPLVNRAVTPTDWMCIDGTLHVDGEGNPWLLYCHEWVEIEDGRVYIQRLSGDLTHTIDNPILLFKGSAAKWAGLITSVRQTGTVTNSPFIYTSDGGKLLMIWSSFRKNGEYAVGKAVSPSGRLAGPWIQSDESLNDDGGHAMLFEDFKGRLLMSYHTNESPERAVIRPVRIEGEEIQFLN